MGASHGKSATAYMNELELTGYLRTVDHDTSVDVADSSTFADDDHTFVIGLADAKLSAGGLFDATYDAALVAVLGSSTQQTWQLYPYGEGAGATGRGVAGDMTSAKPMSEIGDVVKLDAEVQSSVGADSLIVHHPLAQRTIAGTASVVDGIAATPNGGNFYANVTALSGSVVLKVQDSADNVTYADLVSLGTVIAVGGYRGTIAGTVRRYTRLTYTPNPSATVTFVAGFGRNFHS